MQISRKLHKDYYLLKEKSQKLLKKLRSTRRCQKEDIIYSVIQISTSFRSFWEFEVKSGICNINFLRY